MVSAEGGWLNCKIRWPERKWTGVSIRATALEGSAWI